MPPPCQSADAPPAAPVEITSHSDRQTRQIGARLGALGRPGDLILLEGGLGTGKTTLAQGIGQGLGVARPINSPTFTLIKEYAGRLPLYHFDLYRLEEIGEIADLGIEEYLDSGGVCVVEWAERAAPLWPESWLRVQLIMMGQHKRRLRLEGRCARGQELRDALLRALRGGARGHARGEESL